MSSKSQRFSSRSRSPRRNIGLSIPTRKITRSVSETNSSPSEFLDGELDIDYEGLSVLTPDLIRNMEKHSKDFICS